MSPQASRHTDDPIRLVLDLATFGAGVEVEETEVSFEWESADEFVAMIEKNAPDNPDAACKAILEAVEEEASDDGTVKFSNLALLAVGRAARGWSTVSVRFRSRQDRPRVARGAAAPSVPAGRARSS